MKNMLTAAQAAKMEIAQLTTEQKNAALLAMAQAIVGSVMGIFGARLAMAVASLDCICNLSR